MDRLGFFMDTEGNVTWFGIWKDKIEGWDPLQDPARAFQIEVEETEAFQALHLTYDESKIMITKKEQYAAQGMIIMTNGSIERRDEVMHMFVPAALSVAQKKRLSELYEILSSFQLTYIWICSPKSIRKEKTIEIDNLDKYYKKNKIQKGKSTLQLVKHYEQ